MLSQNLGQSAFVISLGSLGNLSAMELLRSVFLSSAWLVAVDFWSRAWLSNWAAKISFTSFAREDATVTGVYTSFEMMESAWKPLGFVASEEDDEEDGLDEDGMESASGRQVPHGWNR